MHISVKVESQGLAGSVGAQEATNGHVRDLEDRFGQVTACRVAVIEPHVHQRRGKLYEINIQLSLATGAEVNVSRTTQSDLPSAIANAFKRVRRQLQDAAGVAARAKRRVQVPDAQCGSAKHVGSLRGLRPRITDQAGIRTRDAVFARTLRQIKVEAHRSR